MEFLVKNILKTPGDSPCVFRNQTRGQKCPLRACASTNIGGSLKSHTWLFTGHGLAEVTLYFWCTELAQLSEYLGRFLGTFPSATSVCWSVWTKKEYRLFCGQLGCQTGESTVGRPEQEFQEIPIAMQSSEGCSEQYRQGGKVLPALIFRYMKE